MTLPSGIMDLRATLNGAYKTRPLSAITTCVIHHTAADIDSTPEQIADYHVNSRGYPGIAYHLLVNREGRVYYCGDLRTIRYHAGEHNPTTVGIVLTGDFTKYYPLPSQLAGARKAIAFVQQQLGRTVPVVGHRDLLGMATECPGNSWDGYKELL